MKIITLLLTLFLFTSSETFAQKRQFNFFKNQKTFINNPFELRDPFKKPNSQIEKKTRKNRKKPGIVSNAPSLEGVEIEKIRIVGILLGGTRRAVAKLSTGLKNDGDGREGLSEETYILKEGMVLGNNNAEIRAILPGGVVLVEKLINVYDQEEYLETILPLQTTN